MQRAQEWIFNAPIPLVLLTSRATTLTPYAIKFGRLSPIVPFYGQTTQGEAAAVPRERRPTGDDRAMLYCNVSDDSRDRKLISIVRC
jgi:hypothetical protein